MATIFVPRMSTISKFSAACTTAGWPTTRVSIYEEAGLIEEERDEMDSGGLGAEGLSLRRSASRWFLS